METNQTQTPIQTQTTQRREYHNGRAALCVERSQDADRRPVIRGRAIVFNSPSDPLYEDTDVCVREMIAPEAVTRDLLDGSDILLTLYHNDEKILGRSKNGKGTLTYAIDDNGVTFECEAADTSASRDAVSLVERGDVDGCSFRMAVYYSDPSCVERKVERAKGKQTQVTYIIKKIDRILDMTLTPCPQYSDTACEVAARDARAVLDEAPARERVWREQVAVMRREASKHS